MMENEELEIQRSKDLATLIQNGYETDSAGYINGALDIFKKNALYFILFTILYLVASSLLSSNEALQVIGSLLLAPLGFGTMIVAQKIVKNEVHTFKNFFDGYDKFLDIIIYSLIQFVLVILIILAIFAIPAIIFIAIFGIDGLQSPSGGVLVAIILFAIILFAIAIAISVLLLFASCFLWFKNMRAIDAITSSIKLVRTKFMNWIGFAFMLFGINLLGLLVLGVGLLVSIPISMIAIYVAFEQVVGTDN